jgi:hypothetical protein
MADTDASQSLPPASPSSSAQPEDLASVLEDSLTLDVQVSTTNSLELTDVFFNSDEDQNPEFDYCSPIVMLIVGPEELVMRAHKEVLTKFNSFFATCLKDGRFEEGMENVIMLPDEDPQNIRKILSGFSTPTTCGRYGHRSQKLSTSTSSQTSTA